VRLRPEGGKDPRGRRRPGRAVPRPPTLDKALTAEEQSAWRRDCPGLDLAAVVLLEGGDDEKPRTQ
jgi:hypothetical protein